MAWTAPRTWVAGELVTASLLNTHIRDNELYLKDAPTFDGNVTITGTLAQTGAATFTGAIVANGDVTLGNASSDAITITGTVSGAPLKTYTETRTSPSIGGGALTLDCSLGTYFKVALNANCTVTISNAPSSGRALGITAIFTADGTIRTITWPGSVVWAAGVAPTMTGTNNKRDILTLVTEDGGTTWFGIVVGQNY